MADDPPKPSDRRLDDRHALLKGAQIIYNKGKSAIDCRILDISETGARLEFPSAQLLPHTFDLHVQGMPARLCMLRWAKGNQIGVWFVS